MRWLLPRLSHYQRQHADVKVRLSTSFEEWGFRADGIDVGIILGNEDSSELFYRYLYTGRVTPVCAPAMMIGERGLRQPADLSRLPLIDVYTSPNDWNRWLLAANLGDLPRRVSTHYDTYLLALEAAAAGDGIAMAEIQDIDEDLRSGCLVRPFDISITRERTWYSVCKCGREAEAKIKSFMDWVVAEMAVRNTSES
jgi:LysR family glycine cleavage system transcriptional activator